MAEIERALEECCRAVPTGRPAYKWAARSSALWSSAVFLCNLCFLFSQTIHLITIHFAPSLLLKLSGTSRSAILCRRFWLYSCLKTEWARPLGSVAARVFDVFDGSEN